MAGILKKEDIIQQVEIEKALQSIATEVKKVASAFDTVATSGKDILDKLVGANDLKAIIDAANQVNQQTGKLSAAEKELKKVRKELAAQTQLLIAAQQQQAQQASAQAASTAAAIQAANAQAAATAQQAAANRATAQQAAQQRAQNSAANRAQIQEERLKLALASQQVGSVGALRAQNQLYAFQIRQLNPLIAAEAAQITNLNNSINANRAQIAQLAPQEGMWGKLISAIKTYVAAYISVQAVTAAGKAFFNQTKELDQLAFGMRTVIKSSVEFAETQKFLSELAVNYGGDLLTLSERYIKFRAAAMQSNMSALETRKIFDSVSKAAGTLGLKTDELSGVYLALEQMISKGKVTTEELRRQLGERLPGAFGIMANALGVTLPELDKMLKKGEVLSKDALPKFAVALEKAYGIENLKKIDTLAAAQGRMSTEFTKFIEAAKAGDTFKGVINFLASSLHLFRDNISFIKNLSKGLLLAAFAWATFKMSVGLANVASRSAILSNTALTLSTRLQVIGLTAATRAWNALKLAIATNPLSFAITAITTIASALFLFSGRTKEVNEEIKDFAKETSTAKDKVDELYKILGSTTSSSNLHKEALNQLNDMSLKYNTTLQTGNGLLDKNNTLQKQIKDNIDAQLKSKYRLADTDKANMDLKTALNPLEQKFIEKYKNEKDGYNKAQLEYKRTIDAMKNGTTIPSFGLTFVNSIENATSALKKYDKEILRIQKYYGEEPIAPKVFDIKTIKDAEDEFKKLDELTQANKANGTNIQLTDNTYSSEYKSFKEFLLAKLKLADDYVNAPEVKEAIGLALGGEVPNKKDPKGNEFTSLERLKEANKQKLDEMAKSQQELLGTKVLTDDQIALADKDNKAELLLTRLYQIEEEKKLVKKGGEEFVKMSSEYADIEKQLSQNRTDYIINEDKRLAKEREDQAKLASENFMSGVESKVNDKAIEYNQEAALQIEKVKNAKDAADRIRDIEYALSLKILNFRKQEYLAAIASNLLTVEDKEKYRQEIENINLRIAENAVDQSKQGTKTDIKDNKEKLRSIGEAVNESFNFSQQLFSNQEAAAKKRYDDEIKMAGDSAEGKILADRKYEQESIKIKRKQAIADKAQAIFNIGLTLAMATAKLNAFQIIAATLAMATILAKPIPEYFMGTENLKDETFSAGERGTEAIIKPDGTTVLTPNKKTIFSDKSFVGSTILPADKTSQLLQSYAMSQSNQIVLDLSSTNSHLATIAKNTKNNELVSFNAMGKRVVKRGNTTLTYIN